MAIDLKKKENWAGVWTALITPFKASALGAVLDEPSLKNLIETQIEAGIHGLVIAGSTGEGSLLSDGTYEKLLESVATINNGRIALVAGLGIGGTESSLRRLAVAKRYLFNGVLASPPAYIKAPQRGLRQHFLRLADEGLPICVYEIPGRAAQSIELNTLKEICHPDAGGSPLIVAVKDATANMERALHSFKVVGEQVALLSGDDGTFVPFQSLGGRGIISVVSHFAPRLMVSTFKACEAGEFAKARRYQVQMSSLIDGIFLESNPVPTKALAHRLNMISENVLMSPLCPMKPALIDQLVSIYQESRLQ